jgi:hypothetical protein
MCLSISALKWSEPGTFRFGSRRMTSPVLVVCGGDGREGDLVDEMKACDPRKQMQGVSPTSLR